MDTKKVFSNGLQKKGGKDSTRVILTAAGATTVAAAAAGAAVLLDDEEKVEEPVDVQEQTTEDAEAATTQQSQQTTQQQTATTETDEIQPVASQSDEIQPTGDVGGNQQTSDNTNNGEQNIIDDVDPDLIAQEITAVEIDPNDVDVADMIEIDGIDTLYGDDGSEMSVAAVHTQDGGQYLMVDVDNDMTFDVITDLEGNPIVQVDSNLTYSDVEDMMDETGNELAYNPDRDEQELANGEDPEDGILDTLMAAFDDDEENLVAENKTEESEVDVDDEEEDVDDADIALDDDQEDDDIALDDDIA